MCPRPIVLKMEGIALKVESKTRKVRSDKKRDVKPTVHLSLYECVSRLSYITNTPIKDVAEYLCLSGLHSVAVIEDLSELFRRDYQFKNTLFIGEMNHTTKRVVRGAGVKKRISIRFQQSAHDKIADLAYSLDMTISSTVSLLLDKSIMHTQILDRYITKHVTASLDPGRKKQLKEVISYIRKDNPHANEITLTRLIGYIIEEFMDNTINAKKAVEKWLDKHFE